ncbi:hypothetical protein [Roseococcus sp. YIM B11640]|uniref:hypothetical protein n=1 Tax=Roseococcus sp. YIM B11640 TaxID=3133973 RepID=UPI003C7D86D3
MRAVKKTAVAALALTVAGSGLARAQSDTCEGVVSANAIMTSGRARADGTYNYTIYVQNRQARRIVVTFVMGNFPANVTLDLSPIQNFVMNANFTTGFRLGTGRNSDINNRTVDFIYRGTSSKAYVRMQDCRPY